MGFSGSTKASMIYRGF